MATTTKSSRANSGKLNSLRNLQTKAQQRELAITESRLNKLAQESLDRVMAHSEELFNRVEEVVALNADRLRPHLSLEDEFKNLERTAMYGIRKAYQDMESSTTEVINSLVESSNQRITDTLDRIAAEHTREFRFVIPGMADVKTTNAHHLMPELLRHMTIRQDVALIGPSGSGKTSAARMAAEALGLPFHFIACSDDDMSAKWFGYMNPVTNEYVPTQVYEWFTNGGVLLIDEYDNMRGNIGVRLNAMLDNGLGDFPCGEVMRHPDAICVAAGNTIGRGATRVYRSRNGLDESTIERFDVIEWGYDEDLERKLGPVPVWTDFVIAARAAMLEAKLDYVISPRASIKGGKLLLTGLHPEAVRDRVVFKQWPADDVARVMRAPGVLSSLSRAVEWFTYDYPKLVDEGKVVKAA